MYIRNFFRRYFYEYCIRNTDYRFLSFALGFLFTLSGVTFSLLNWKTDVNAIINIYIILYILLNEKFILLHNSRIKNNKLNFYSFIGTILHFITNTFQKSQFKNY